jgi:hypothetical protein
MKLYRCIQCIVYCIPFLFLPGCLQYSSWLKDVFYQGEKVETHSSVIHDYLRSEHVYDQFSTVAHIDALWLSEAVRTEFARLHAQRNCLSREEYNDLLCAQREETKQYILFYVLTAFPYRCGSPLLCEKEAEWSICLQIDEQRYKPQAIILIDLLPEYCLFFGKAYTRFKIAYEIRFNVHSVDGFPLLLPKAQSMRLIFSRIDRYISLIWHLYNGDVMEKRQQHSYQDVLAYDMPTNN